MSGLKRQKQYKSRQVKIAYIMCKRFFNLKKRGAMKGMYVLLERDEREMIVKLAQIEKRDPRQQAALLIRKELERLGLLKSVTFAQKESARE